MLKPGIKILTNQTQERVWLSNGTVKALEDVPGLTFREDAVIPQEPWQVPSGEECDILFAADSRRKNDYSNTVSVVSMPAHLVERLRSFALHDFQSQREANYFTKHKPTQFNEVNELLREFMDTYDLGFQAMLVHNFHVGPGGRKSSTIDYRNNWRVGLHVDSWYSHDIASAHESCNRICINLSETDRYFLFVNQSMLSLYDWVKEEKSIPQAYNKHMVATDFCALFPSYKVAKLKIKPFEAYIAPTENIIHDGSSEGNPKNDITVTARGYFWAKERIREHVSLNGF